MNMKSYQEFMKIREFANRNRESNFKLGVMEMMPKLKKKYKKRNITDTDTIIAMEKRQNASQKRELDLYLELAKVYEISDKHKFLLMMTTEPKMEESELWQQVRLPFPEIFIDVSFQSDEINNVESHIHGILIKELKSIDTKIDDSGNLRPLTLYGLTAYITGISNDGLPFVDRFHFPILFKDENESDKIDVDYMDKKEAKFIRKFIINFILFLKDREVVWIESKRTKSNQMRRIRQNKMPLPSSNIINLTGELKRYVNSLQDSDFKGKLTHKFWVSGTWRTYRSSRYKKMRGKVQWIEPFQKGTGIEVRKVRRIIPDDDEEEINYDDIKPLKKSLRSMRI